MDFPFKAQPRLATPRIKVKKRPALWQRVFCGDVVHQTKKKGPILKGGSSQASGPLGTRGKIYSIEKLSEWKVQTHEVPDFLARALDVLHDCDHDHEFIENYLEFQKRSSDLHTRHLDHATLFESVLRLFHSMCRNLASNMARMLCRPSRGEKRPVRRTNICAVYEIDYLQCDFPLENYIRIEKVCYEFVTKVTFLKDMTGADGNSIMSVPCGLLLSEDAHFGSNVQKFRASLGTDVDDQLCNILLGSVPRKLKRKVNGERSLFRQSISIFEEMGTLPSPNDKCRCLMMLEDSIWLESKAAFCKSHTEMGADFFHRALIYVIASSSECSLLQLPSTVILLRQFCDGDHDFGRAHLVAKVESAVNYLQERNTTVGPFGSCPTISLLGLLPGENVMEATNSMSLVKSKGGSELRSVGMFCRQEQQLCTEHHGKKSRSSL